MSKQVHKPHRHMSHDEIVEALAKIRDDIEIIGHFDMLSDIALVRCKKCGHEWEIKGNILLDGSGCKICSKTYLKTTKEYQADVQKKCPEIEVVGEYTGCVNHVHVRCKVCGHEWNPLAASLLHKANGCPECAKQKRLQKMRSFTPQEFKSYIEHKFPQVEVIGDYVSRTEPVLVKCVHCSHNFDINPNYVLNERGSISCPICGDGISYPNKFGRAVLRSLPIENFKAEWRPRWPELDGQKYFYDNYFEYCGNAYVVEMDGGFHYSEGSYKGAKSLEEIQEIDDIKNQLAINHGIKVIRIDCNKSNPDYIRNNIENSELGDIFDLSVVDWDECNKIAQKSAVVEVCNYYMNVDDTICRIAEHFEISKPTVVRYLRAGEKLGMCDYPHLRWKLIDTFNSDGELYLTKRSVRSTAQFLRSINIPVDENKIRDVLFGNSPSYKGYIFKYA